MGIRWDAKKKEAQELDMREFVKEVAAQEVSILEKAAEADRRELKG